MRIVKCCHFPLRLDWQALRTETKFTDQVRFGKKLPQIRRLARADAERLVPLEF